MQKPHSLAKITLIYWLNSWSSLSFFACWLRSTALPLPNALYAGTTFCSDALPRLKFTNTPPTPKIHTRRIRPQQFSSPSSNNPQRLNWTELNWTTASALSRNSKFHKFTFAARLYFHDYTHWVEGACSRSTPSLLDYILCSTLPLATLGGAMMMVDQKQTVIVNDEYSSMRAKNNAWDASCCAWLVLRQTWWKNVCTFYTGNKP